MKMRNVELLERTMQYIKDHPESHAQEAVFTRNECGTAACFAGWACMLSGLEPARQLTYHGELSASVRDSNGLFKSAMGVAQQLLGLTKGEAAILFAPFNTRRELELMVKDLVNGDELKYAYEYDD